MHCAHCGTPTDDVPCSECGEDPRVVGRYRLEALLGQGGHGTTWRALDEQSGQARAVKELPLRLGTPEKIVALFRREAAVLQQLDHPGVPVCHEALEVGAGRRRTLWIVLDLVDGPSLADELETHRYDEREVLRIVDELLEILEYLHGRSPPVVHRDIKPHNVVRAADGTLRLVDFGSVRDALRHSDLGGSTVAGTFGYMAPEQFAGDAEPRTDLYGLGALAVHLLTRQPPHKLQDRRGEMRFKTYLRVSEGTVALLDRLLATDPDDRPKSAAHARELVRRVQAGDDLSDDGRGAIRVDPTPTPVPAPERTPTPRPTDRVAPSALARPLTPAVAGSATRIALTAIARRRMTVQDHAAAVATIEHLVGASGNVSTIGETLRWSVDKAREGGRSMQVTLEPHLGGTRILLSENVSGLYGGSYGGLMGGLGGGLGGGLAWAFFAFLGPLQGVAYIASVVAVSFLLATAAVRRGLRRRNAESEQLVEALTQQLGGAATSAPPAVEVPSPQIPMLWAGSLAIIAALVIGAITVVPGVSLLAAAFLMAVAVLALAMPFVSWSTALDASDKDDEGAAEVPALPDLATPLDARAEDEPQREAVAAAAVEVDRSGEP